MVVLNCYDLICLGHYKYRLEQAFLAACRRAATAAAGIPIASSAIRLGSTVMDCFRSLVVSPVHTRLDYCNFVLVGLPLYLQRRLQSVLSAAARLVF